jgi:predicted acetyltransferase
LAGAGVLVFDGGVTDYAIRVAEPAEYRAAHTVFRGALHAAPGPDEHWPALRDSYEPGRTWGAFRDGELVGSAQSFSSRMLVPGGAELPMALVSRVGVRADHTRRGLLSGLMRAQLGALSEPFASLRASEAVIYGRFGYGVASRFRDVLIDRQRARLRPEAPVAGGQVRTMLVADAAELLPALYDRLGPARPGWVARQPSLWSNTLLRAKVDNLHVLAAVHTGPDGDDGYVLYHVERINGFRDPASRAVLQIDELVAASPEVWAALLRFVLSVDLVDDVRLIARPLDEPVEWLFADYRALRTESVRDECWLRIVDVPAALAARRFGLLGGAAADSVLIEVRDSLLPNNSGCYRIGVGAAEPASGPADLTVDVDALATLYLGDVAPSTLAGAGRVTVHNAAALSVADRLFAVGQAPWCGTFF